ncbi:MAG: hypothetical protein GKR93_14135 [Gammaproteobacteria bacterium]|nr:hypothetical protein [Gammaproteobacteria bacterium]
MNWQRIALLLQFDFYHTVTRLRGWVFLVPFSIYWVIVFRYLDSHPEVVKGFRSQEAISAMEYFGSDTTFNLFVNNPVIVSLSFLLLIITAPFFTVLASYGQFCSDLKNGFFRFLIARCHRIEIFIARFLSASILITTTFLVVVIIAALMSMKDGDFSNLDILNYSVRIFMTLLLYVLPFVAFMSLLSALVKSELGVIFLGMTVSGVIYLFYISSLATQQSSNVAYLLPIGVMNNILALQSEFFWKSIALLPVYFIVYTVLAYFIFHRRNL